MRGRVRLQVTAGILLAFAIAAAITFVYRNTVTHTARSVFNKVEQPRESQQIIVTATQTARLVFEKERTRFTVPAQLRREDVDAAIGANTDCNIKIIPMEPVQTAGVHAHRICSKLPEVDYICWYGKRIVQGDWTVDAGGDVIVPYNLAAIFPRSFTVSDETNSYRTVVTLIGKGAAYGLLRVKGEANGPRNASLITVFNGLTFSGFKVTDDWRLEGKVYSILGKDTQELGRFVSAIEAVLIDKSQLTLLTK